MATQTSSTIDRDTTERVLVIERIFDAPRALVWKAWADPEHRAQWMGPQGFTGRILEMDFRPGGAYRYYMRSAEGTDHWQQDSFREIVDERRIVCTYLWADVNGNPTRPETILSITLEDYGAGKTKLTLHQEIFESVSARDSHNGGWNSSFDRLAQYLERA